MVGKIARPIPEFETYVMHIFREHNKEADHWANVGSGGKKEITVDKGSNSENWKVVKGFGMEKWMWGGHQRS